MQPLHLLQAMLITGVLSARRDIRQVIVTVTAGITPPGFAGPTAPTAQSDSAAPISMQPSISPQVPIPIPITSVSEVSSLVGNISSIESLSSITSPRLSLPPWVSSTMSSVSIPLTSSALSSLSSSPFTTASTASISQTRSSISKASIASLASTATASPPTSGADGGSAKCGKGYTYCGFLLTNSGHNFQQTQVDKAYCDGLPELCAGGTHKTDIGQAVFICMSDQPSTVELMCACSGTCLNNASSNYIAHCDKPCVNV